MAKQNSEPITHCKISEDGTKRLVEIRPGVWRYVPIKERKK